MMDVRENLKAFLDGQLPANESKQVQDALSRDAGLRREFDELRRISSTLREGAVSVPVVGVDKTLTALANRRPAARPHFFKFLPAFGIAAACVAALVIIGRSGPQTVSFQDQSPMPMAKRTGLPAATGTPALPSAAVPGLQKQAAGVSRNNQSSFTVPDLDSNLPGGGESKGRNARASKDYFADQGVAATSAPTLAGQEIVKTGELTIAVPGAKDAVEKATVIAKSTGGYVESSNVSGEDGSGISGSLTIRIPATNFDTALNQLRNLGKVSGESTNGQDVTAQIVDIDARLKVMRTEEQAYVDILAKAKHVDDVLSVRDRLDSVRQDIESMAAQSKTLKSQAAMSTIHVTFNQKRLMGPAISSVSGHDDWLGGTWSVAWSGLASAGRKFTEALIYLVVFCPVWIPVVLLGNYLTRRGRQLA
jgi:hypothetical protein